MTDDEIRAAIAAIPDSARFFPPNTTEIAIYRAGMRAAARIARELALKFVEPVCEIAALRAADAIDAARKERTT